MEAPNDKTKPEARLPEGGSPSTLNQNLVVIGANGAGKSRLGVWLEAHNINSHRISAQRALRFQESIQMKARKDAESELRYGRRAVQHQQRKQFRWGNAPANHVLNDFDALLATLFARKRDRDTKHSNSVHELSLTAAGPIDREAVKRVSCELDEIATLWEAVFPHRELVVSTDTIEAKAPASKAYPGAEMSDGERVAIYLAGQALCAPIHSVLIIDEPEIHIHRSLLEPLFDRLERLRTDCIFVYLTHDTHFAASRSDALKLWLKDWDGGQKWSWEELSAESNLPEDLLLLLMGNRKPVLFVEGQPGSLDARLFKAIYPNHLLVPRGSCDKVIEAAKAYQETPQLSHVAAAGIVDRDRRSEAEIQQLKERGVHVLEVAEIENLLVTEGVVRLLAEHQGLEPDVVVGEVKEKLFDFLAQELDTQVSGHVHAQLKEQMERILPSE